MRQSNSLNDINNFFANAYTGQGPQIDFLASIIPIHSKCLNICIEHLFMH